MAYCSKCGASYESKIDNCPKCGSKLPTLNSIKEPHDFSKPEIENKKGIISLPAATISKRLLAGIVDLFIGIGLISFILLVVIPRFLARRFLIRGFSAFIIIYFLSALYFIFRDSLSGKSVGKLIFALTVINLKRGKPADLADSILRNSILGIIAIPVFGWITFLIFSSIITVQISLGKAQRIGDGFAHTKVIEDKYLNNIYLIK